MGERRIDVNRSGKSVVDSEFDSMRDRFENEMRRVDEEMQRLRQEFDGYRPAGSRASPLSQQRLGSTYSSSPTTGGTLLSSRPIYDPYFENLKSPLIRDESDGKSLRLRFDVSQYKPEEVTVKTVDNRLLVYAKHEEKSPSRTVYREYNQEFMLPRGTNPELISSTLSTDGILTVEAPLPQLAIK
ncbi:SHSP domain-containing protein [Meloidogyne graminicola]|uniref:SHSP domain-containing protein n=1 Tax=Meloidogyne graminicola TaxID=189291 RepID=A0A8T0A2U2_9BILA|nr:SHSP domain-containing protein [Meloidogyne graminicola]